MSSNRHASTPAECPVCGVAVPPKARACPNCGADERTGWNEEQTRYDGLDLPEEAFGDAPTPRRSQLKRGWLVVAVILMLLAVFAVFGF